MATYVESRRLLAAAPTDCTPLSTNFRRLADDAYAESTPTTSRHRTMQFEQKSNVSLHDTMLASMRQQLAEIVQVPAAVNAGLVLPTDARQSRKCVRWRHSRLQV